MPTSKSSQKPPRPAKKDPATPAPNGAQVRVTIMVDRQIAARLDKEIAEVKGRYPGVNPTRSSVARALVARALLRRASTKDERVEAYRAILKESSVLKLRALKHSSLGDGEVSRQLYLLAAARDLEALAVLRSPGESTVMSALIEAVGSMKAATGYKSLPDVPKRR